MALSALPLMALANCRNDISLPLQEEKRRQRQVKHVARYDLLSGVARLRHMRGKRHMRCN